MASGDGLAALSGRVLRELCEEFPTWRITRDESGRWCADLPGWGRLYGRTATELRERLRRYGGRDLGDDL
jgi:hypothetical protein